VCVFAPFACINYVKHTASGLSVLWRNRTERQRAAPGLIVRLAGFCFVCTGGRNLDAPSKQTPRALTIIKLLLGLQTRVSAAEYNFDPGPRSRALTFISATSTRNNVVKKLLYCAQVTRRARKFLLNCSGMALEEAVVGGFVLQPDYACCLIAHRCKFCVGAVSSVLYSTVVGYLEFLYTHCLQFRNIKILSYYALLFLNRGKFIHILI
jgi:hypothetical protein